MPAAGGFTFVTWNVLATAYIRASYYPSTDARFLEAGWRVPALTKRARAFDADLIALQEVEPDVFEALRAALAERGYAGTYAQKREKPEGGAVFYRGAFDLVEARRIEYRDGSGHIAQLVTFDRGGSRVAVLNTHLKWDAPNTPPALQFGFRQASEIIVTLQSERASHDTQIICGDLNVTPDSDVVQELRAAGFVDAHRDMKDIATCNSNGVAKLIDYVFHRGALRATPVRPPAIDDATALPSDDLPSDHAPLEVRFA